MIKIQDRLSSEAREILKTIQKGSEKGRVMVAVETLEHDGYDEDGPRSNLWELYVIDKATRIVQIYHREDWFYWREEKKAYHLWNCREMEAVGWDDRMRKHVERFMDP
jgi:hypothetical protein